MSFEIIKIAMFTLCVGAIAYVISKLVFVLFKVRVSAIHLAISPILGLTILALQLWLYGLIHVRWSQAHLLFPWVVLGLLLRKQWKEIFAYEKRLVKEKCGSFPAFDYFSWILIILSVIFGLAYFTSLITQPLITSDVLAMWGYKAKEFFLHSGVYVNPRLGENINSSRFFHIDYPPLLPLNADVFYVLLGHINESLLKSLQFLYFTSGAAALFLFLREKLRHQASSFAPALTFLFIAAPQFLPMLFQVKYMAYADYPLAVVFLISAIFIVKATYSGLNSDWYIALCFAGFAAVIKNEGVPFLGIILTIFAINYAARLFKHRSERTIKKICVTATFVLITSLPVLIWSYYKIANDITVDFKFSNLANSGMGILDRVRTVISLIWLYIRTNPIYHWEFAAIIITTLGAFWIRTKAVFTAWLILILQILSYVISFIFSPYDLTFHILGSIDRLSTQILPLVIFLLSLEVATSQTALQKRRRS